VALSGGTIPGEEKPSFTLPDDEIEFGMGAHGEPGTKRMKIQTADDIVDIILEDILLDSGLKAGDRVCTLVNGLGSTTLAEMYIMNRHLSMRLREKGIEIYDMEVNSYITTQEMAGASITMFRLDDELKKYYDMPCWSPYYSKR
jgi:dihydroxyacetone kinase